MQKIIAIDFDGTLCEDRWPDAGPPKMDVINKLKAEQAAGAKVILWTCRNESDLDVAVRFCADHGIHLDAVNDNLPEIIAAYGSNPRKITASEYWDDRAVLIN